MVTLHPPSNSYVVVFLNDDNESQKVRALLQNIGKIGKGIQQIDISSEEEDVPRLVTQERVFSGFHQIQEYCTSWLPLKATIPK